MRTEYYTHACGKKYLVWDYQRGEIVCIKCGAVLEDRLPTEQTPYKQDLEGYLIKYNSSITKYYKNISYKKYKYNKFKKLLKILKKSNNKEQKNRLEVDTASFEKYIETGNSVLVLKRTNENLHKLLDKPEVKSIIENKIKNDPRLNSRTLRSKVAIALIIKEMRAENKKLTSKEIREIAEQTGTSVSHVKRLYYFIKNRAY